MMRRRTRRAVLAPLFAVVGLVASMTAGPPLAAASTPDCPTPTTGVSFCFNAPPPTDGTRADNNEIQTQIDNLIASAKGGQTVRVSIYLLDSVPTVDALISAFHAGANVKVIADKSGSESANKNNSHEFETLFDTINGVSATTDWTTYEPKPTASSYVALCPHSCIDDKSINHQKFVMVSNSNGGTVVMSSANMLDEGNKTSTNSGDNAWNNSVVFADDKSAYQDFTDEFDAQKKGWEHFGISTKKYSAPKPLTKTYTVDGGDQLLFYPRPSLTTSPTLPLLTGADCKNKKNPTTINVAMDIFSDKTVADRLRVLSVEGCKVTVIATTHSSDDAAHKVLESCPASHPSKVALYVLKHAAGLVHSKYMVITGSYNKGTTPLVYTGSLNFDANAYEHADNTEVLLHGTSASKAYNSNYAQILAAAKKQKGKYGLQKNAKCS